MRIISLAAVFLSGMAVLLSACSTIRPDPAASQTYGTFSLATYFTGHVRAWGLFEPRFGGHIRQFTVDIHGHQEGDLLTLTEDFQYSDGQTETRIWKVRADGPDRYIGTADDVIGTAVGHHDGNSLHWAYDLNLKTGDGHVAVTFDDWLYRFDDRTLLNRATVSKLGVTVGSVTLAFHKIE